MHKESLCGNCLKNSYLKVCDLQSAFNSSDSVLKIKTTHTHTHVNTFTNTHLHKDVCNQPSRKCISTNSCHLTRSTPVQIWVFIESHYSQIAYWILNIVFTLRLIEAFCFQTVSCNVFKQKKCSAIHCLQPESVISTTAEIESMPFMQTQFISNLLSLSLLGRRKMLA